MSVVSTSFELPGLHVHALVDGPTSGQPVVLLHGFPELSESWRDVLPIVAAAGYRAIAPDLRGYGGTDKPKTGYDIGSLALDVVNLARVLGGPIHLVGHDWGGGVAYEVAARHPEVIRTFTAVNAPHPRAMSERAIKSRQIFRSWYMFFFQIPLLPERMLSHDHGARVPELLRRGAVDTKNFTAERLAPYARAFATPALVKPPLAYYRKAIRGLLRPTYWREGRSYPRIAAPFRLIWGTEDRALGVELTRDLDPYFTSAPDVVYLPGVGHSAPLEAPEKVGPAIVEHLKKHA
jgi:pimeloyl-ACP methyl ester carboxylesterase